MRIPTSRASASAASSRDERSEEHTSELQSRRDLVCRLLLEKKKKKERKEIRQDKNRIVQTDVGEVLTESGCGQEPDGLVYVGSRVLTLRRLWGEWKAYASV